MEKLIDKQMNIANNWCRCSDVIRKIEDDLLYDPKNKSLLDKLEYYKKEEEKYHNMANELHKEMYGITFDEELDKIMV